MDKKTQKKLLAIVRRNYEEIADDFFLSRQKRLWPPLEKLAKEVPVGARVLDVGCGSGRLLKVFLNKKIEYLGVDTSRRLIELAREQFEELKEKAAAKFQFRVGDILELNKIPEINFDYVFCVAVLHHLPGADWRCQALKQLKNKISPRGRIIITVWNLWSARKARSALGRYTLLKLIGKNKMDWGDVLFYWQNQAGQPVSQRYYHAFRRRELKRLAKKAGLAIDRFYKDKYNYYLIVKKAN